jgi:hypothetical protein
MKTLEGNKTYLDISKLTQFAIEANPQQASNDLLEALQILRYGQEQLQGDDKQRAINLLKKYM